MNNKWLRSSRYQKIKRYLKEIAHKENVAVFVSSHILSEMQLMCDKVAVIDSEK